MNRSTLIIFAAGLLMLAGCPPKQLPMPENGAEALRSGNDTLQRAVEFLNKSDIPNALSMVTTAQKYFAEAKKKDFDRDAWYANEIAKRDKWVNDARATAQYRGAFLTMGVVSGFGSILGVFLLVSGIISAYPKAGLALIAAGLSGVALSIVAPELQAKSTIVAYGIAIGFVVVVASSTLFIIWHQWKSLKRGAQVIDKAKTEIIPNALMASPEDIDTVPTLESAAKKIMDAGVTRVFNVARKQLRAAGVTRGDVIDGETVGAP